MKKRINAANKETKLLKIKGWFKHESIINIITAIILAIMIMLKLIFRFEFKNNPISEFIDFTTLVTVLIAAIINRFAKWLQKLIYSKNEDLLKLTINYTELCRDYYPKSKLFKYTNRNTDNLTILKNNSTSNVDENSQIVFPIEKAFDYLNAKIEIHDNPDSIYKLPYISERNYDNLLLAHEASITYNNICIRVKKWQLVDGVFHIYTERTTYFNSLVTNRAIDYELNNSLTIRDVLECGPYMNSLETSELSNHVGFNMIIESSDGYIPLVYRNDQDSIAKRMYGTSVSASIKTKSALNDDLIFTYEKLFESVKSEIADELFISKDLLNQITIDENSFIAAYRDFVEGGKPQLLFYVKFNSNLKGGSKCKLCKSFKKGLAKNKKKEFESEKGKKINKTLADGEKLIWIKIDDLINNSAIAPDMLVCNKKIYRMVPSTSASVAMLLDHLSNNK